MVDVIKTGNLLIHDLLFAAERKGDEGTGCDRSKAGGRAVVLKPKSPSVSPSILESELKFSGEQRPGSEWLHSEV